jgi:hypothetical protein
LFSDGILESTDAHPSLSMSSQSILSSKACPARTLIRLVSGVDFSVSLEIMLSNEALATSIAAELSVSEMRLNVRANILSASKNLSTIWI